MPADYQQTIQGEETCANDCTSGIVTNCEIACDGMEMNDALEAVREADSAAQLTGYPHAVIVRNGQLIVVKPSQCRDDDIVAEVFSPR